ncbi:MAG: CRISPR-associated protein, Csy1 family [uncultured Sulfurovum sp.]|uniref:CRISPR-associated protein, Csy1 family n=1 Tax=uncultured Sulfurovum sp. TaxID=269237 RepID=A0A6S6S3F7_9BACT|nr:MAG: CRISPR-associated protein, Csy1 family [uncultured Sulfurovum sp.]
MNEIISKFFDNRKEAWIKKNLKSSMEEDEVLELHEKCAIEFSRQVWLPNASKRAGQISMATHPCTFSHPSARKNKNGYVTSIIANVEKSNDGFFRTGNVEVQRDALGNAAALDVHKFLTLLMPDGKQLIEHIQEESQLAISLLTINTKSYEELRDEFLAMVSTSTESVTSSKIKQVYFPVKEGYHQLSILTNSGMIFELRKRLNKIRFGEDEEEKEFLKMLRNSKRNNEFSEDGYREIYNLTTIAYGGTKPQNISVLNSQNGGKAQLLYSMPPVLDKREIYFPKTDFFKNSMSIWDFKETFFALDRIYKTDYNNINIREGRDYRYGEIIDKIIDKMWAIRNVSKEQYYEKNSKLKHHQKIWLHDKYEEEREKNDEWLEKIMKEISSS